jgi:hypothetical protein
VEDASIFIDCFHTIVAIGACDFARSISVSSDDFSWLGGTDLRNRWSVGGVGVWSRTTWAGKESFCQIGGGSGSGDIADSLKTLRVLDSIRVRDRVKLLDLSVDASQSGENEACAAEEVDDSRHCG